MKPGWPVVAIALLGCGRVRFDAIRDAAATDAAATDAAAVELVQHVTASEPASVSVSATLPSAPARGDMLVMVGASPNGLLSTVTGGGVTWNLGARSTMNANCELWFGVSDGSNATVTIASAVVDDIWMSLSEWHGFAPVTTGDGETGTYGDTSPASAGAITTGPQLDAVFFGVADIEPNTFGAPSDGSWTIVDTLIVADDVYTQTAWWELAPPNTPVAPAVTDTGNHWDAVLVALPIE